ncbi:DUF55-domain-containing protein [Sodiomyces alkalinus F11]|uniref:Thymocyte nuclear protein 1 n=1 Tax=Sodiomyces alkalinus (strain CBS 110278 / VKM F-3762 / F11) TaxID=1314773 RepID=A0A3N2PJB5_SODAK|nr:DUF55-domain-containing protein [Sodiomyces alkalinus F11]ROT34474.1 DUF55-domain-containing protein [Sodiomyces alkalinus F11]
MPPATRASRKKASETEKDKPGQPYPQTTSVRKAAKTNGSKKSAAADKPSQKKDDSPPAKRDVSAEDGPGETSYWLMKSEPESRFENGQDIKFSIDDLAARTAPEGWDGIRNYAARNNLRAMKKGDKAFFYHSNCKPPGIVGIMSIIQEHSPDWDALNQKSAYYDGTAPEDGSKWSLVHVKIEHKFPQMLPLHLLRDLQKGPLQDMQLLRQSRLSVSKVTEAEWEAIVETARNMVDEKDWVRSIEETKKSPNYNV